jgi:hypothetical protein
MNEEIGDRAMRFGYSEIPVKPEMRVWYPAKNYNSPTNFDVAGIVVSVGRFTARVMPDPAIYPEATDRGLFRYGSQLCVRAENDQRSVR